MPVPARCCHLKLPPAYLNVTSAGHNAQMRGDYEGWSGHVIVCGLHGVGLLIVEELSLSGVPAVVVDDDPDPRLARTLHGWGVPHVAGSPRSADTLTRAGLAGAAAVICALGDDLHTLEAALLTRELRAGVRVIGRASCRERV